VSPEILAAKVSQIGRYLQDFRRLSAGEYESYLKNHYAIERLIELLIISAVDVVYHLFRLRQEPPATSYSSAFLRAGEMGIMSAELAGRLARAAGMRNLLVHGYDQLDQHILFSSMPVLEQDMVQFITAISQLPELSAK
jgi:uncharacterized protein YutE (UPF0331/DUF86 family)